MHVIYLPTTFVEQVIYLKEKLDGLAAAGRGDFVLNERQVYWYYMMMRTDGKLCSLTSASLQHGDFAFEFTS